MIKNKILILSFCLLFSGHIALQAANDGLLLGKSSEPKLMVNNRVLAKINDKIITTYDVMKKMDVAFFRNYPLYASSLPARYQYYDANWKYVLEDLINKELILADAKEIKVEVSTGDVRQEMELTFGPNVIENLDKIGMSYDEAQKIMQGDLILRRMIGARVHAKALRLVTPTRVRKAYEDFIQDANNVKLTSWRYQVLTIRDRTTEKTHQVADAAYELLVEGVALDRLVDELKERQISGRKTKITISDEIENNEKELSIGYKQVLENLDSGMYSEPSEQISRVNNETVYRIFYVKEKVPGGIPSFKELEPKVKESLLNEVADIETEAYLNRLRRHFHVRENDLKTLIPDQYQPFAFL